MPSRVAPTKTPATPSFFISDLCKLLDTYLEPEHVKKIYDAYLVGAQAHEGQHRATGEPYIYHPVEVARILGEMHMDPDTIAAAVLHDVIEDTELRRIDITRQFGKDVAMLVDGVSKLTQIEFGSRAEAQAENFRKMMLAMTKDIRVILVKLADRLHNMRTLSALREEKRRIIARETLEIYAPIANRLGINNVSHELEDLGFANLYPLRARVLQNEIGKARGHRKEIVRKILAAIRRRLRQEQLVADVEGREKHMYSLYKKMRDKRLTFQDIQDIYAFRIVVDSVDMCYRVLGAVHNLYKPVPGKFKDYIAIPKVNGYQSLHTVLFGPFGVPIEVQIRTRDMHEVAESGIAAHWRYKADERKSNVAHKRAREWMRELLEMQQNAGDSLEFIENVKVDLFPDEVYVFTPNGDIFELPRGATPVDFAYAVHTDVGNTCVAAKIDRHYVPLGNPLTNGQTVEIVTAPWGHPNPHWLNFVVTGKARANVRHFLKNLKQDEAHELGSRLLRNALAGHDKVIDDIDAAQRQRTVGELGLGSFDELLVEIGLGNRVPGLVAKKLVPDTAHSSDINADDEHGVPLVIRGTEGMVVNLAKCCRPIPGDLIQGFVSAGRGIVIHTSNCRNLTEKRDQLDEMIDVEWQLDAEGEFPVEIRIDLANQRGMLATVAAAISDAGANIDNVDIAERDGLHTSMQFLIEVADRQHLARVIRRLRAIPMVHRITRLST